MKFKCHASLNLPKFKVSPISSKRLQNVARQAIKIFKQQILGETFDKIPADFVKSWHLDVGDASFRIWSDHEIFSRPLDEKTIDEELKEAIDKEDDFPAKEIMRYLLIDSNTGEVRRKDIVIKMIEGGEWIYPSHTLTPFFVEASEIIKKMIHEKLSDLVQLRVQHVERQNG